MLSDPDSEEDAESIWTEIKYCLINAGDSVTERRQQRKNIWKQKGKQNQAYMLLKEKPMQKNLVSWKVVMVEISFSNQLRE